MKFLSGNEATALGAIQVGVRFFAGYPITPSTEIAEYMAKTLPPMGGVFIQMEDELASMSAVIGAAAAGMKAMTATSGPGFSLMQEGISFACMAEIPCLIANVMRTGPSTGLPTKTSQADLMQTRWGAHGDHPIVALAPCSVTECFDLTVKAMNIALRLRLPVFVLTDEIIGHMREKIEVPEVVEIYDRKKPQGMISKYLHYDENNNYDGPYAAFNEGYRFHITGLFHYKDGFPTNNPKEVAWKMTRLRRKIDDNITLLTDFEAIETGKEVAIVSFGSSARSAKEVALKYDFPYFRVKTVWPFPTEPLREFLESKRKVIVPEMNQGQMIYEVERAAPPKCQVVGVNRVDGELITPEEIEAIL